MRRLSFSTLGLSVLLASLLALQGCVAVVETGRDFPADAIDDLVVGETTIDDAVSRFGEPVVVTENTAENTTVLGYQANTEKVVSLGLPPIFLYGWRWGDGVNLNLVFINGVYQGHQLITRQ